MLTEKQNQLLCQLADGGYMEFGHYGGILPYVYNEQRYTTRPTHGGTIKALLKRNYIERQGRRIVISEAGRAALSARAALFVAPPTEG